MDELLANPAACLELGEGVVPLHAFVIVEYVEPASSDYAGRRRLVVMADEDMPPWLAFGMLRQAELLSRPDSVGECGGD